MSDSSLLVLRREPRWSYPAHWGQCIRMAGLAVFPHFPGCRAAGAQALEMLLVFEGVHALPEAVVAIGNKLLFLNQSLEGFGDQFFVLADVLENPLIENEEPTVDSNAPIADGVNPRHETAVALVQRDDVVAEVGSDAEEARDLVVLAKVLKLQGQRKISQTVAVIRQKDLFP